MTIGRSRRLLPYHYLSHIHVSVFGVFLDELPSRLNDVPHEGGEDLVGVGAMLGVDSL
jgi:hypothetical protein